MLASLLNPRSIAVVGVSSDPDKVGHQIFVNLSSFPGKVYPINPKHKKILGKACYPTILAVPSSIDMVVIATPAATVEALIHECIDKKVKAVSIITAGFAETSSTGKLLQQRISSLLASKGIALLGPNTLGVINPYEKLNASFAMSHIELGNIGLISQSGAMLTTIFSEFASRNVGCSFALSLGNKAGVTENEALEFARSDPHTKIIALYLESLQHPETFIRLCKDISKQKPIILLKGGQTSEGQKASLSHTAALATDTVLLKEAALQMGFVMVETIEQFFEATFFLEQLVQMKASLPSNMMILTNAGGPGVNATDVAATYGLSLATWDSHNTARFRKELPRVRPSNPTDLLGDAQVEDIQTALELVELDTHIESTLLIITPQAVTDIPGITAMLIKTYGHKGTKKRHTPLIVALMGGENLHQYVKKLREHGICTVEYANEGVEIFGWVNHVRRSQLVDRSSAIMKQLERVLTSATPQLERRRFPLQTGELEETYLMLEKYGFILPRSAVATSLDDINEIGKLKADRVFPLIAKTANMKLKHKALVGGVIKNIRSLDDATEAYKKLRKFSNRVLLQEVIENAAEVIMGGKRDTPFGPFVAVGLGGSLTNILSDRSYMFLPASHKEMRAAFKRTKLAGTLSVTQRELVLVALEHFCQLFLEHTEIAEMELNPLLITTEQAYVVDVKVTLK